jgi:spermidine/putrescine transport system permease protein
VFPQALPGLVAGCALVWIPALGEYVIPTLLGGGKTFMVGNLIALRFIESFNWPLGAAMSVALMAFALVFLGVVLKIIGKERLGETVLPS